MRMVFDFLGDLCARRPGPWSERLAPWVLLVLGGGMVGLMIYACVVNR